MKVALTAATVLATCLSLVPANRASAHVDLEELGFAGERQILDFTVGHGCSGSDTVSLEVRLPAEITSVRALPWAFGNADVLTNDADIPVAVVWTKPAARMADDQFYTVSMRVTVPDTPFQTLYFPAVQTCRSASGEETEVEWIGLPGDPEEPAPALRIVPVRHPGWNRFMPTAPITDLTLFEDAEIVWQGDAAFSSNPATMELIATEPGVTVLAAIAAGTDVWVKF
jgi:uncharacterized protein YcnI